MRYKVQLEISLPREIIVKADQELPDEEIKKRVEEIYKNIFENASTSSNAIEIEEITITKTHNKH